MCIFYLHQNTLNSFLTKLVAGIRLSLLKNSISCPKISNKFISIFIKFYILWPFRFSTCKMSKTRTALKNMSLFKFRSRFAPSLPTNLDNPISHFLPHQCQRNDCKFKLYSPINGGHELSLQGPKIF